MSERLSGHRILHFDAFSGAAGNMICVHNVVAASAVVGMLGREGQVIRRTFFPFVYYALFTASIGYSLVWWEQMGAFNAGSMIATAIMSGAIFTIWRGNRV